MNRRQYISTTILAAASRHPRPAHEIARLKAAASHARYWRRVFIVLAVAAALCLAAGILL